MYERERSTAAARNSAEIYFNHAIPARPGLRSKSVQDAVFYATRSRCVLGVIIKG